MSVKVKIVLLLVFVFVAGGVYLFRSSNTKKTYYDNGNLKQILPIKNKIPHGRCYNYFESGVVKSYIDFKNGIQDGAYFTFYPNGQLKMKKWFGAGIQVDSIVSFYENGSQQFKTGIKHGKYDGEFSMNFESGIPRLKGWYKDGKFIKTTEEYSKSGEIIKRTYFQDTIPAAIMSFLGFNNEFNNYLSRYRVLLSNSFSLDQLKAGGAIATFTNDTIFVSISTSKLSGKLEAEVEKQLNAAKNEYSDVSKVNIAFSNLKINELITSVSFKDINNESKLMTVKFIKHNNVLYSIICTSSQLNIGQHKRMVSMLFDGFSFIDDKLYQLSEVFDFKPEDDFVLN